MAWFDSAGSDTELRERALWVLQRPDGRAKAEMLAGLDARRVDACRVLQPGPGPLPGRPARPHLVAPRHLPRRGVATLAQRAALIHALAHIEFNAIHLALDTCWRFPGLPEPFYREFARIAMEEAQHFSLLAAHLETLGFSYGDFPGHDGLWEAAQKTERDLLARLAVVPCLMEARALDASPGMRDRLGEAGDEAGAAIVERILNDEIRHVAIGHAWFHVLCRSRALDPVETARLLARAAGIPAARGPFNLLARRAAGFTDAELAALEEDAA